MGIFPHPHHDSRGISTMGKHHVIKADFDVAVGHPHSRPVPSVPPHLGQIPVPIQPQNSPPLLTLGRPAHCLS
jgi:hypothetical protein